MRPMLWSVVQQFGRQGTTYVAFLVLGLLLSPQDFGIVAMAAVWLSLMQALSEWGFGAALVQRATLEPRHLSTAFYCTAATGVCLALLGVLGAPLVAAFFDTPAVRPVVAWLSVTLAINGLGVTQLALAQRELRFRDLAVRDTVAAAVGGAAGIALAVTGRGVWSLVVQSLVTAAIGTALLWRLTEWRPRLKELSPKAAKELWPFGSRMLAFAVFKFFAQNTDRALVGAVVGSGALGAYAFGWKVVLVPTAAFAGAVGAYLFPKLSRLQGDLGAARTAYVAVHRMLVFVVMPAMVLVAFGAPTAVPLVFGTKWASAVPLIQVFAAVAVAQTWIAPVGQVMKSLNRPEWLLRWSIAFTAMTVAAVGFGSRWGAIGVAGGVAVAHAIGVAINVAVIGRLLPGGATAAIGAVQPALVTSLVMVVFLSIVFVVSGLSAFSKLAVGIVGSGLIACGGLLLTFPDALRKLWPRGAERNRRAMP